MLTEKELINGIRKCILNGEHLISDAKLLQLNNRKERAYTLFQLASEEIGKASLILNFLIFEDINDVESINIFMNDFKKHKLKTDYFISFDYLLILALKDLLKNKTKFLSATLYEHQNLNKIDNKKNFSLYTSILNDKFITPQELITKEDLEHIEFRVFTRFKIAKPMLEIATKNVSAIRKYIVDSSLSRRNVEKKI